MKVYLDDEKRYVDLGTNDMTLLLAAKATAPRRDRDGQVLMHHAEYDWWREVLRLHAIAQTVQPYVVERYGLAAAEKIHADAARLSRDLLDYLHDIVADFTTLLARADPNAARTFEVLNDPTWWAEAMRTYDTVRSLERRAVAECGAEAVMQVRRRASRTASDLLDHLRKVADGLTHIILLHNEGISTTREGDTN